MNISMDRKALQRFMFIQIIQFQFTCHKHKNTSEAFVLDGDFQLEDVTIFIPAKRPLLKG